MGSTGKRTEDAAPDTSLLGREMDAEFWGLLDRDYLTSRDMDRLTKFIPTKNGREEILRKIASVRASGWTDNGQADLEKDPGANKLFMPWFKDQMKVHYGELVHGAQMDPLTRAAILSSRQESSYAHFLAVASQVWTCWIEPGADGYIVGVKGSGKTSKASLIARLALDAGIHVIGAIKMGVPVDTLVDKRTGARYWFLTSGTQMLRVLCTLRKTGVKVLVLLDEGMFFFSGETPLKGKVMHLRMFSRLFRKLGASMVDITQRLQDVPSELVQTAAFRVTCYSREQPDRASVQLRGMLGGDVFTLVQNVKRFPDGAPHTLPYMTGKIATFVMDLDPEALMEYLSTLPHDADELDAAMRWADDQGLHFHPRYKRWICRRMHECGLSMGKIAEVLGISKATVHAWCKKEERAIVMDEEMGVGQNSSSEPTYIK